MNTTVYQNVEINQAQPQQIDWMEEVVLVHKTKARGVGRTKISHCRCSEFKKWKNCRHVEYLLFRGSLPAPPKPAKSASDFRRSVLRINYYSQIDSSKRRGHKAPEYSIKEFIDRFLDDPKYISLFEDWDKNGRPKYLKPSFDRIDNSKGYSFENINLTTWKQNEINGNVARRKPIYVFKDGVFIDVFDSRETASKFTGYSILHITNFKDTGKTTALGYSFFSTYPL